MNTAQGELVGSIHAIKYIGTRIHLTVAENYPCYDETGHPKVETWLSERRHFYNIHQNLRRTKHQDRRPCPRARTIY